jgi:hypothetical protein
MECVADRRQFSKRGGFVLIMIVVAVAIGLIIYMMMLRAVMPDMGGDGNREAKVWEEEWRLDPCSPERIKAAKKAKKYLALKPAITEKLSLEGAVTLGAEPRGRIRLVLLPDGSVKATWESKYTHGDVEYEITAESSGVTDPTRTFEEGGTPRPELLYFICRGKYTQKSWDARNELAAEQTGVAYVDGWLSRELAARGQITLTTDKRGSAVYQYAAAR